MGQVLHRGATTTEAVRRALQHSQEILRTAVGTCGGSDVKIRILSGYFLPRPGSPPGNCEVYFHFVADLCALP